MRPQQVPRPDRGVPRRLLLGAALAVALLGAAPTAGAGSGFDPGSGPGPRPERLEGMVDHLARALDLDDATRAGIEAIVASNRPRAEALDASIREQRRELHDLLAADSPDEAAVMAKVESLGALETEMHKLHLATLLAVRARLSPEQRKRLVELHEERRGRLFAACAEDVASLCPEAGEGGRRRALRCLWRHGDALSPGCREALPPRPWPHHGPPGEGPPGPPPPPPGD